MKYRAIRSRTEFVRRMALGLRAGLVALALAACGGGGGGGDDVEPPPPPPGGTGTGADGVPVFWSVYDNNVANGFAYALQQTADGGFVGAGSQMDGFAGGTPIDFHVFKTDPLGARQWTRRIAWPGNGFAYAVRQASDGTFMVAGTGGAQAASAAVLIKLDAAGNTLAGWPKTYGPAGVGKGAAALHAVNGGADGWVVAGFADAGGGAGGVNVYVLRIGADGAVLWQKFDYAGFCAGGYEAATAIAQTTDGHYVVAGTTGCLGWAGFLQKVNASSGAEIWRHTFDGDTEADYADLSAVVATADGGVVAAGKVGTDCGPAVGGSCDALVIKADANGNEVWRRVYGGAEKDGGNAVALAADGSVLVAGVSRSYGGSIQDPTMPFMWSDTMLMKISPAGVTQWHKIKGIRPRGEDSASAIVTTADGGFAIAGSSGGNVMLAKFDKNGATVNLGAAYELSIDLPPTLGVIAFGNAVDTAGLGAAGLVLPRELGAALVERLLAASAGDAPSSYCTGGGSYAFAPAVPAVLAAGGSYALTLADCITGSGVDQSRINGSVTLMVDSVSGTPPSGNYTLQLTAANLSLTVDEPASTPLLAQSLAGGLRIVRVANAGSFSETLTTPVGVQLLVGESSGGTVLRSAAYSALNVHVSVPASGALTIGIAGDALSAASGSDHFVITLLQPITLSAAGEPSAGGYRVTAQDASRLTATLASGSSGSTAALAVDTNADGIDDGTIAVPWEFVY